MQYFLAVLYGLVFGIANIIPGVSGGTMLVVFGCYDKVCGALSLNFKEIKKNIVFLIFFGIGAAAGIVAFSFVITWLFKSFPTETYMFFIGLIVGSIPLIIRNATIKQKFSPVCLIPFLLSLALIVWLSMMETAGVGADGISEGGIVGMCIYLGAGFVAAVAMLIPGVSGSFVMVLLGTYESVIAAIKGLDFSILVPTAIGVIAGLIFGARLISFLMKRYRLIVFSAILGLVAGSIYAIFPAGFGLNSDTFIGAAVLILGFFIAYTVGKHTKAEEETDAGE